MFQHNRKQARGRRRGCNNRNWSFDNESYPESEQLNSHAKGNRTGNRGSQFLSDTSRQSFMNNFRKTIQSIWPSAPTSVREPIQEIEDSMINRAEEPSEAITEEMTNQQTSFVPMVAWIDHEKCSACGECISICPVEAISFDDGQPIVNDDCIGCQVCELHCPEQAILFKERSLQN